MADEKERAEVSELSKEGGTLSTQEKVKSKEEEVLYDDKDPIEVLRATAIQLGLNPDEVAIMSRKELQSQIDKAVTQAIQTREMKLRKQTEIEKMKEKGQWEQLLKQERYEALQDLKQTLFQAKGLPTQLADMIDVSSLADKPLSEAKEALNEIVDRLTTQFNEIIEAKVSERLKSLERGTFTSQTIPTEIPKTREELLNLPYEKQVEIFTKYPDIFKKLTGG